MGKEVAKQIATKGATVHIVCRNEIRGKAAVEDLAKNIPKERLVLHIVDMSRPKEVIAFARAFQRKYQTLDILINNVGCMLNKRSITEEGFEGNFATNTLGSYVLTEGLMPLLERTENSRVVNVTSGGMLTQKLDYSDLQSEKMGTFDGTTAYAQTKRQLVELGHVWAKEHPSILFLSAHPGWADTQGVKGSMPSFYKRFKHSLRTVEQGADTILWSAISPEATTTPSGSFIGNRKIESEHLLWARTKSTDEDRRAFVNALKQLVNKY